MADQATQELLASVIEANLFLQEHVDAIKTEYAELVQNMLRLIETVSNALQIENVDIEALKEQYAQANAVQDYQAFLEQVGEWSILAHCAANGITPEEFLAQEDAIETEENAEDVSQQENIECIETEYMTPMPEQNPPKIRHSIDAMWVALCETIRNSTQQQLVYTMKKHLKKVKGQSDKIFNMLVNYYNQYQYWGTIQPEKDWYEVFEQRAQVLKQHLSDFEWLYLKLQDYRSKKTLLAILNNWVFLDFETLGQVRETCYMDYFDPDLILCDEKEVLVDLGAYTGDTVLNFVNSYPSYQKIYCYEITPHTFEMMRENLREVPDVIFRQKGASAEKGTMYISAGQDLSANQLSETGELAVETVAIDEDIQEPVTFIKMDIEGAEQGALLGCKRHIMQEHPKLAICTYHNNEDIWKIPRMIHAMNPEYRFYMRYNGGNLVPTEYVLFAL